MTKKTKRIGISSASIDQPLAALSYVDYAYVNMVTRAGGTPFILPNLVDPSRAEEVLENMDALILTGGADLSPFMYGENPLFETNPAPKRRDDMDTALYHAARKKGLPIIGICRGMQLINVLEGGTLWQDLPSQCPKIPPHRKEEAENGISHYVTAEADSFLGKTVGERFIVNSLHHQAIREMAPGLRVTAMSDDGIIEAFEGTEGPLLLCTQFHIERLSEVEAYQGFMRAFMEAL